MGFRSGYAIPFGKAASEGSDLSTALTGMVPIWLDLGYRSPNLYAGAFFEYGVLLVSGCDAPGVNCSGSDVMAGIDIQAHALPEGKFDPWAGFGAGYEWGNVTTSSVSSSTTARGSISGWQLFHLQGGLDLKDSKVMPGLGIGPFVMLSFGQYENISATSGAVGISAGVPDKAIHEWFTVGFRGAYDIPLQQPSPALDAP